MKTETNLCMGCMNEKLYKGPCEICGYDESESHPGECLPPKTFLSGRYIIGDALTRNGEGCVYIAFDTVDKKKVDIKEFMPDMLCKRAEDGESIIIPDESLPLFKSYLSEFADLHKTLMSSGNTGCLRQIYGIFAAGSTGYVIMEHPDGVPLAEYLSGRGGKVSWEDAQKMLPPILGTLEMMHSKGIVHRGLSPETIIIRKDGSPMITSVGISALRTADSRINYEMYTGYAACEQYALSERQGSWTDVYGICAVLYKMLTGTNPPYAKGREKDDRLVEPFAINQEIPKFVSDAIVDGMKPAWTERIHTIALLKERLFSYIEPADEPTAAIEPEEPDGPITPQVDIKLQPDPAPKKNKEPKKLTAKEKREREKKKANTGFAIGLIIFLLLIAGLVAAIFYFSNETQRIADEQVIAAQTTAATTASTLAPETTAPKDNAEQTTADTREQLMMPSFIDRFFNAQLESRYSMLVFDPEYEYNDEQPKGIIFAQSISEGTRVAEGTVVKVKISQGPSSVPLPYYKGYRLSYYLQKLAELGIKYDTRETETSEVEKGYVAFCSKNPGEAVSIEEEEVVIVYYAVTPTVTEPPETEPPQTEAQETEPPATEAPAETTDVETEIDEEAA